MRILFLLLFSLSLNAQVIFSDNFSNYARTDTTNIVASWLFDNVAIPPADSITGDRGGRGYGLIGVGWDLAEVTDSLVAGSFLTEGGTGLRFAATGNYFNVDDITGFPSGVDADYTVVVVGATRAVGASMGFFTWGNGSNGQTFYSGQASSNQAAMGTSGGGNTVASAATVLAGTGIEFIQVAMMDAKAATINFNKTEVASATFTTNNLALTSGKLGVFYGGTGGVKHDIYEVTIYNRTLTANEIKEYGYLPDAWTSTHGNVLRNINQSAGETEWFQTAFSDTICVPLSNTTLADGQEFKLTINAKDTVTVWIGSRSLAKSNIRTVAGGAAFTSHTEYWSDFTSLSGDSLVIAFPADTASVDNVVLSKASHHLIRNVNRWITW